MNDTTFFSILYASVLVIASIPAHANLIDRGNGTIYDSNNNLTWLKDTNYAATELSDARVLEIVNAVGSVDGHTLVNTEFKKTTDGNYHGGMSVWASIAWADQLVFAGFDDWRLPTTTRFDDPTCSGDLRGDTLFYEQRYYCLGGEMEYLDATESVWNNPLFENLYTSRYWTATRYRDWKDPCTGYPDTYDVECNIGTWTTDPNTGERIFVITDNGIRIDFYWQVGFTGGLSVAGLGFKTTLKGGNSRRAWAVRDNCGFDVDLAANRWTMISLPCAPIETVNTVASVFGDDLIVGDYGTTWVVYEWDTAADSYTKLSTFSALSQNTGYWILSLEAANLDAEGDDTQTVVSIGECAVLEGCYEISLAPPAGGETEQYNLVGHVFPGTIPWKDIRIRAGGEVYTPSAAKTAGIMDETIWLYNGNVYNVYNEDTPGMEGQLTAFDGFWVKTLENAPADITLLVPKVAVTP